MATQAGIQSTGLTGGQSGALTAFIDRWIYVFMAAMLIAVVLIGFIPDSHLVFAGDRRGIIYVQGERVANVPEEQILDRLLAECRRFQDRVERGEAKLGEKVVEIVPPDPIGELGSGFDKIAAGQVETIPAGKITPLTISKA